VPNSWIRDQWPGAHAQLVGGGVGDVCTLRPAEGDPIADCTAYVDREGFNANQLGVDVTKDQAIIRVLKKTTSDEMLAAPKAGDVLDFAPDPLIATIVTRVTADDDSWTFICKV
jgi:hypothetical protein